MIKFDNKTTQLGTCSKENLALVLSMRRKSWEFRTTTWLETPKTAQKRGQNNYQSWWWLTLARDSIFRLSQTFDGVGKTQLTIITFLGCLFLFAECHCFEDAESKQKKLLLLLCKKGSDDKNPRICPRLQKQWASPENISFFNFLSHKHKSFYDALNPFFFQFPDSVVCSACGEKLTTNNK